MKGRSLLQLVNLPSDSSVLMLGFDGSIWKDQFEFSQVYCGTDQFCDKENYDLVFLDMVSSIVTNNFKKCLKLIKKKLAATGILIISIPNSFSFKNLKSLVKRADIYYKFSPMLSPLALPIVSRYLLPWHSESFLAIPDPLNAIEFVAPGRDSVEIPWYANSVEKLMDRIGWYKYVHAGYWIISSKHRIEENGLLERAGEAVSSLLDLRGLKLRIDRFEIRERGALVIFISENMKGNKFIIRVTSSVENRRRIQKNHLYLTRVHQNPDIPDNLKNKLPYPLDEFNFGNCHVFMESRLPGILAWKVETGRVKNIVYKQAADFIIQFFESAASKLVLNEQILTELFSQDMEIIDASNFAGEDIRRLLLNGINLVRERLLGRKLILGPSHGDYGHGNIMVDEKTGHLRGVIDWDTGRFRDFPGIDFINLLIQKRRSECRESLRDTVAELADLRSITEEVRKILGRLDKLQVVNSTEMWRIALLITVIRYITRAMQYPTLFCRDKWDFFATLDWSLNKLPSYAMV